MREITIRDLDHIQDIEPVEECEPCNLTVFVRSCVGTGALSGCAVPVNCSDYRPLFRQGESPVGLYVIHSGTVTITMDDRFGDVLSRARVEPGSLLGLPAVIANVPSSLSAEASAGANVSLFPLKDFARLMLTEPGLAIKVLQVLAAKVRAARSMITVGV